MRAIIAALICGGVLVGSTVLVAQRADTSGAQQARMVALLSAETGGICDCAVTRARVAAVQSQLAPIFADSKATIRARCAPEVSARCATATVDPANTPPQISAAMITRIATCPPVVDQHIVESRLPSWWRLSSLESLYG